MQLNCDCPECRGDRNSEMNARLLIFVIEYENLQTLRLYDPVINLTLRRLAIQKDTLTYDEFQVLKNDLAPKGKK